MRMQASPMQPTGQQLRSLGNPAYWTVIPCVLFVLTAYVWLVTVGQWTSLPDSTDYYDQLASAFVHGHLYLNAHPDPALLALPNPYDRKARVGIPFPKDFSLYQGKFYLYFGPAPALFLAALKFISRRHFGDQYLVLAFLTGIFLLETLFILKIRQAFFPGLPPWLVALCVLLAGLVAPFTWMLGQPDIYSAAIAAGQFFFLAGLYCALHVLLGQPPAAWKLSLAGLCWAAAIGSRMTQILPVAFITALIIGSIIWRRPADTPLARYLPAIFGLASVLGLGLILLGWYNWARFNSVFESGFMYALAAPDLQANRSILFSPIYLIQNVFLYGLNPPQLAPAFPYLTPALGIRTSVVPVIRLTGIFYTQENTGILYTAPFVLFGILPPLLKIRPAHFLKQGDPLFPLILALTGVFLCFAIPYLAFFWVAERYTADFLPALLLLSGIGLWQLDQQLETRPRARLWLRIAAILLMVVSIAVSSLLALSINAHGFRNLNPSLWRYLNLSNW
jgi:hypothetical protein